MIAKKIIIAKMPDRAIKNIRSAICSRSSSLLLFIVFIDAKDRMHEIVKSIAIIEVNSSTREFWVFWAI